MSAKISIYHLYLLIGFINSIFQYISRPSSETNVLTIPTKDDWIRGCLYAIAMGTPLLLEQWITRDVAAFIALGAMFTLRLDPRCQPLHQIMAMLGGMLLMISAGILGSLLLGHRELAIAALLFFSFIAGQPTECIDSHS